MSVIWITGANGQVGRVLQSAIHNKQHPWSIRFFSKLAFDLTEPIGMASWFRRERPLCIINLAAYTAVDQAESDPILAYAVNATGVMDLANLCAIYEVPLIHVSTDYVFSGQTDKPYDETATPASRSVYGQSKVLGEEYIRASQAPHVILRTSWVFSEAAENFVTKILQKGFLDRHISVISDQIGCPTAADNLVTVLCHIVSRILERKEIWGTYHYCDRDIYSWFSFAEKIIALAASRHSAWQDIIVSPILTSAYPTSAPRPAYSVLNVEKLTRDYSIFPRTCNEALEKVIDQTMEQLNHVSA